MFLFDLGLTGPNLAGVHHYYVVVLQCLIYLAVGLSVLVAADRIGTAFIFNIMPIRPERKIRSSRPKSIMVR